MLDPKSDCKMMKYERGQDMKKVIIELKKSIKEYEEELSTCCITSTPYIITCEGVAINPEIVDGKTTGKVTTGLPHTVKRFSERDDKSIAAVVKNGNRNKGIAKPYIQVVKKNLQTLKELLVSIK